MAEDTVVRDAPTNFTTVVTEAPTVFLSWKSVRSDIMVDHHEEDHRLTGDTER